jgi:hypothetical protein
MKQPVIEVMAFSSKVEFGLPQENASFEYPRVFWP